MSGQADAFAVALPRRRGDHFGHRLTKQHQSDRECSGITVTASFTQAYYRICGRRVGREEVVQEAK
jgi:hypothetical protein